MKFIKHFFTLFCILFTINQLTFSIFDTLLNTNQHTNTMEITLQTGGLAFLFVGIISLLDYLSNTCMTQLGQKTFILIQYVLLLITIILWARHFTWGDWHNPTYVALFIFIFSLLYLFVYVIADTRYKQEDKKLTELLKTYQNKIKA